MQDFAKYPEIPTSPFPQLAKVPLNGCSACQQVTGFSRSRNEEAEDALCHFVRLLVWTPTNYRGRAEYSQPMAGTPLVI